jgi:cytidine deaminase
MKPSLARRLIDTALQASRHAVAPYSNFPVGAAVLTVSGKLYTGVNVESASFGLTCCAERVALFKALSEGERDFVAIAVVAPDTKGPMPCGACRQLLAEFAPRAIVFSADSRKPYKWQRFTVAKLLPRAFLFTPSLAKKSIPDYVE